MSNRLSRLHDAHNGRLALKVAIRCNPLMSLLVLLFGLFELNLVDLDSVFVVCEAKVDAELVGVGNLTAFGVFGYRAQLGAC